jgi:hypothetical protein
LNEDVGNTARVKESRREKESEGGREEGLTRHFADWRQEGRRVEGRRILQRREGRRRDSSALRKTGGILVTSKVKFG